MRRISSIQSSRSSIPSKGKVDGLASLMSSFVSEVAISHVLGVIRSSTNTSPVTLGGWSTKSRRTRARASSSRGEPALQDLAPLARLFRRAGYHVGIETNGTVPLDEDLYDWICVSPKDQVYPNVTIRQRTGHELKVVDCGQDLARYESLAEGFDHLFLQPCYDASRTIEENGRGFRITEQRVKDHPGWRLSLQTHKWMVIR